MFVDFLIKYIGPPNCGHVLLNVLEQSLIFVDILQSFFNMCLDDVCSWILPKPHKLSVPKGTLQHSNLCRVLTIQERLDEHISKSTRETWELVWLFMEWKVNVLRILWNGAHRFSEMIFSQLCTFSHFIMYLYTINYSRTHTTFGLHTLCPPPHLTLAKPKSWFLKPNLHTVDTI